MNTIKQTFILILSTVVLYVWIGRFNEATFFGLSFRGGDANTLFEEFTTYGLNTTIFYLIGGLKIISCICLLIGLKYQKLIIPAASIISILMLGALGMHLKVGDELIKYLPSGLLLLVSLTIIQLQKRISAN